MLCMLYALLTSSLCSAPSLQMSVQDQDILEAQQQADECSNILGRHHASPYLTNDELVQVRLDRGTLYATRLPRHSCAPEEFEKVLDLDPDNP